MTVAAAASGGHVTPISKLSAFSLLRLSFRTVPFLASTSAAFTVRTRYKSTMVPVPNGEPVKSSKMHSKVVRNVIRHGQERKPQCLCLVPLLACKANRNIGHHWLRARGSYSSYISCQSKSIARHVRRLYGKWTRCGRSTYYNYRWYCTNYPSSKVLSSLIMSTQSKISPVSPAA